MYIGNSAKTHKIYLCFMCIQYKLAINLALLHSIVKQVSVKNVFTVTNVFN